MANADLSEQVRHSVEALHDSKGPDVLAGCRAGDLKGLLNAIVDQISEADRRHSDTLQQLQERLSGIGREAKAIKPRVPENFASAFERIEAGMTEIASRIAEASESRAQNASQTDSAYSGFPAPQGHAPAAPNPAPAYAPPFHSVEPPAALRSASDAATSASRRRDEEAMRAQNGIDTFDVIESLPGNVTDPWDHDAAEALAGVYDTGATTYAAPQIKPDLHSANRPAAANSSSNAFMTAQPPQLATNAVSGVDHLWLEQRFSDISKRIEEQLSDVRPDEGFFAVGQRVDQLERHFSNLIEGVATRGDVEGVRLIEAHVSELAGHLENAHQQLMRLDAIEDHLVGIAGRLEDVHQIATSASSSAYESDAASLQAPQFDIEAVARTAAEAAAAQFAQLQPPVNHAEENAEVRDMLRGFISESRLGEENTTALLDTLQQAMIRLLDRVDQMEMSAMSAAQERHHSAPQEYVREQVRFSSDTHHHEPVAALDAAVAAVASAKSMAQPFAASPAEITPRDSFVGDATPARTPEKLRQDFIAEARRAKMRLAAENAEGGPDHIEIARPAASADAVGSSVRASAKTVAAASGKTAASSPRIKVIALVAATLALGVGGGWYVMQGGSGSQAPVAASTAEPSASLDATSSDPASTTTTKAAKSDASGATNSSPDAVNPEAGNGSAPTQLNLHDGTHGAIDGQELIVGANDTPMMGVAVDTDRPMSAADLARAKHRQAMADMSGKLGQAAVQSTDALPSTIALAPERDPVTADTSVMRGGMSQTSALDLPPASVGPLSLRLAAANGDPSAEFEVGARLAEGKGTGQNFKDAAKWYQRSASKGFAQAQYRLGTLYERGLGLKVDPIRAADWYQRSAEQGNIKAMHNLAVLSANQTGGSPDYATAASWFSQAADHGLSDSQFNLAVLHENGLGVDQDLTLAYKWVSIAARSGDKEAIRRRDILQGKMTAEQLTKAQQMIGMWKPKSANAQINDARKAGEAWKANPANGVSG